MQVLVSSKEEKPVNPLLMRLFGERKLLNQLTFELVGQLFAFPHDLFVMFSYHILDLCKQQFSI